MVTIRRILWPTDFSEASSHALDQAIAIAQWYEARITALHVGTPASAEQFRTLLQRADTADVSYDTLIDTGDPASTILRHAAGFPADLIVLGTHGAHGFERLVVGSVTEKVLRKATCPVITVPPHAHRASTLPFRKVLCAVDFSDWSEAAVNLAADFASKGGASLSLVHVIEWPWHEPPAPTFSELPAPQAAGLAEYRRYVEQTAKKRLEELAVRQTVPTTIAVRHGKSYVQVISAAAEEAADLIVLGVHGRNPIDMALLGSTTNHVVRLASCPVLTLRR